MSTTDSILNSTKKMLGLDEHYGAFDLDVMTNINTVFLTLNQLGIGPYEGFAIEGVDEKWVDFTSGVLNYNAVKTYVYLRVRLLFDPPESQAHLTAMKEQVEELTHRLLMERELTQWQP